MILSPEWFGLGKIIGLIVFQILYMFTVSAGVNQIPLFYLSVDDPKHQCCKRHSHESVSH
jgi:hypothetical protein